MEQNTRVSRSGEGQVVHVAKDSSGGQHAGGAMRVGRPTVVLSQELTILTQRVHEDSVVLLDGLIHTPE
jgi:hypothetical protein